jgi:hypothetical protein
MEFLVLYEHSLREDKDYLLSPLTITNGRVSFVQEQT